MSTVATEDVKNPPRYYRCSHTKLYCELDALELYETWFVPNHRLPVKTKMAYMYNNQSYNNQVVRGISLPKGILFVRIE